MKCHACGCNQFYTKALRNRIRFDAYNTDKKVLECFDCGLTQLLPQWDNKELSKIYKNYSKKPDFKGQKQVVKHYIPHYIEKHIKSHKDSVLEIGCSIGYNVKRLNAKGYNVVGIDMDKSVCDGKTILNKDLFEYSPKNKVFNLIYGIHVFEHVKNPCQFLNKCLTLLDMKGTLVFEMPNIEDPLFTIYKNEAFESFYWRPDHHFFYSVKTITQLLSGYSGCTFKVERLQRYGLINHLNWIFRSKPTNNNFHIPVIDTIYKFILTHVFKKSDTLIFIMKRRVLK